jgi:hypothetical protein
MRGTRYAPGSLHDDAVCPFDEGYEDSGAAEFGSPLS